MKIEGVTAGLQAVLFSFVLYVLPTTLVAGEIYNVRISTIEPLEDNQQRITLFLGNRLERLTLTPNPHLNDVQIIDAAGNSIPQSGIAYQGTVESLESSTVSLYIDGSFIAGTSRSHVETDYISSATAPAFNLSGAPGREIFPPPAPQRRQSLVDSLLNSLQEIIIPVDETLNDPDGGVTRVANIAIVVDSLYEEALGGRGLTNAIATINSVDALYREKFNLALKLETVLLIADEATLGFEGTNIEQNLLLFRDYRIRSEELPEDLALVHLFTGVDSADQSIGLAYSGAACRTDGYDVSLSRPFRFPVELTAHEIGHNLGAAHDDQTIECLGLSDHLMFSQINANTIREFSSCSAEAIISRLQQNICYTDAIDISVDITELESNQILASISNLDQVRAFPTATVSIDLVNASVAEAPADCVLEDPEHLTCTIPATFAGDTRELAVKLRIDPTEDRTINMQLDPVGFYDLNNSNNVAQLLIEAEEVIAPVIPPVIPPVTEEEIETPVTTPQGGATPVASSGASGGSGGGVFNLHAFGLLMLLWIFKYPRRRLVGRG